MQKSGGFTVEGPSQNREPKPSHQSLGGSGLVVCFGEWEKQEFQARSVLRGKGIFILLCGPDPWVAPLTVFSALWLHIVSLGIPILMAKNIQDVIINLGFWVLGWGKAESIYVLES